MSAQTILPAASLPRLAFVGLGWIGRNRMEALLRAGCAQVAGLLDVSGDCVSAARTLAPDAAVHNEFDGLLADPGIDGIVLATPSAQHAGQTIRALEAGKAVFCQKPLGRDAAETQAAVDAARRNNRLLGIDFSYRYLRGVSALRDLITGGSLGRIYSIELTFHNAYGPDKPWFYDPRLSGGGCLIDLGIHLLDLVYWLMPGLKVQDVSASILRQGFPVRDREQEAEDFASAHLKTVDGTSISLACSWHLPAGRDAVIGWRFYGTGGAAAISNVHGSFYDFVVERYKGTCTETIAAPPDDWAGRALIAWTRQVARDPAYDPAIEIVPEVAQAIDRIYQAGVQAVS